MLRSINQQPPREWYPFDAPVILPNVGMYGPRFSSLCIVNHNLTRQKWARTPCVIVQHHAGLSAVDIPQLDFTIHLALSSIQFLILFHKIHMLFAFLRLYDCELTPTLRATQSRSTGLLKYLSKFIILRWVALVVSVPRNLVYSSLL